MKPSSETSSRRRWGGILLGLGISAALLVFLARNIEFESFYAELQRCNPTMLLLVVLVLFVSMWVRAIRWRYLLPSNVEYSTLRLFEAILIGFFATFTLPFRAGEIARPWALSRWQDVTFMTGFASVVVERVFDVLALMVMFALCLSAIEVTPDLEIVVTGAKALGVISGAIILAMGVAYVRTEQTASFIRIAISSTIGRGRPEFANKLIDIALEFLQGLRAISSFGQLVLVVFWSLVLWLVLALMYQVGLWTFGDYPSFWVGMTLSVFIAFAVAAPSAPGFLGTFQLGCVLALSVVFGFSEEYALAFSLVMHAVQLIIIIAAGAFIIKRTGLSLGDMKKV